MPKLTPRRQLRKGKRRGHPDRRRHEWQIRTLVERAGGRCEYCDDEVNLVHGDPKQATVDHVIPLSKGGTDRLDNLALACAVCNHDKADEVPPCT